jgi:hypothetical protein
MDNVTEKEFAVRAIRNLRKGETKDHKTFLGIHTRYSGFNDAWRKYYGTDPVVGVNKLIEQGMIYGRPAKGGFMIYLPEDKPKLAGPEAILGKILGAEEPHV